jgi:lysophospholipase L1-like esterase
MQPINVQQSVMIFFFCVVVWACQKSTSPDRNSTLRNWDTTQRLTTFGDTGVCIGNSIIAGHPWNYSGLETNWLTRPDSPGQINYRLTQLTKFPWINHGWGGQNTVQIRKRFLRDAIGLTVDVGDARPNRTLGGKPSYVVIEGGVNDFEQLIPLSTVEDNIVWMASTCKQYNIHCIVLNCVGQGNGRFNLSELANVKALNTWLADGALDSVNVTLVDINSLWNSGTYGGVSAYGNDNVHYSSLVDSADGIHFTKAGYDSIAYAIFRVAKLPITTK